MLCTTSFASVQFEEAGLGAPLWDQLGVPVFQLLCSSQPLEQWRSSSIGLGPTDLGLQVALPELDGRITTRIAAFKETRFSSDRLASALARYEPDVERIGWVCQLVAHWIDIRQTPVQERRVALVLANYPTRNSRLANGVGLDTPASTALMLGWMQAAGYSLGSGPLPLDGDALIGSLMAGLTNDPESGHHPPSTTWPWPPTWIGTPTCQSKVAKLWKRFGVSPALTAAWFPWPMAATGSRSGGWGLAM